MNPTLKRLMPALGLLVLLAGCGSGENPVAPYVIPPLSSIVLAPAADTLDVGATRQFTAVAVDTAGDPYTGSLNWKSTDRGVCTVGSTGLVHAVGEGSARLIVSGGGQADTASVLVYATGTGWVIQTSNASEDLFDVYCDADGRLVWVVGADGLILTTSDAGETWTRHVPSTYNLHGVWFTSGTEGWAVGDGGTILHTLDGGTNWTRITTAASGENLRDVYFTSRDVGWVVGANGQILATADRGATWSKIYRGGETINGVMFADADDGWAVADGGLLLGTHNGGDSWFIVQPSITSFALKSVWRRSTARAVAVGASGTVVRTAATADSVAWSLDTAGNTYQFTGVCFPADLVGYGVGSNGTAGFVLRSNDGGATWHAQTANSVYALQSVFFVDERRGWAVGNSGIIRHTASGGE